MAAAPLPLVAQRIDINASGEPDSPGLVMSNTDTLAFYNLSPYTVSIHFICANGPVFDDINNLGPNKTSTAQRPLKNQITTDYQISSSHFPTTGPFSVEVAGNPNVGAPLLIEVAQSTPDEDEVAIPINGWIQFDLDVEYDIEWTPATAFPSGKYGPGLTPAWRASSGNAVLEAEYTLTPETNLPGHGTVHINS
ncbi:MAG TPA: hypothetical protein VKA07_14825 [Candidatus Sulfotelmatobacter sp.]|nr:hypothetical protein [Candidatus Sulfotelmatobacter sp.]